MVFNFYVVAYLVIGVDWVWDLTYLIVGFILLSRDIIDNEGSSIRSANTCIEGRVLILFCVGLINPSDVLIVL